jgi:hypothetical protein
MNDTMELDLIRVYDPEGTNGAILHNGLQICHTVELPWLNNQRKISCIPEGRYELRRRFTEKRKHHLEVMNVPGRNAILIHPANNAKKELLGCIAPVTELIAPGKGSQSRFANEKLKVLVLAALDRKQKVFINIKSKNNEHYSTGESAHP